MKTMIQESSAPAPRARPRRKSPAPKPTGLAATVPEATVPGLSVLEPLALEATVPQSSFQAALSSYAQPVGERSSRPRRKSPAAAPAVSQGASQGVLEVTLNGGARACSAEAGGEASPMQRIWSLLRRTAGGQKENDSNSLAHAWTWLRVKCAIAPARRLRIAETISLGEKRFVAIVAVEGREFLIGGGSAGMSLLARLGPEAMAAGGPGNELSNGGGSL